MSTKKRGKESKTYTTAFGIPVADDLNSMTAGPDFTLKKWCDVLLTILQVSHCQQNQSISPLKLIRQMGTEALYS